MDIGHQTPVILFDSLSTHFTLSVFVEQFLHHLFCPLLFPYFFSRYGIHFIYAQNFEVWKIQSLVISWGFPICLYISVGIAIAYLEIGYEVLTPVFLYIIHKAMVALKYATLTSTEFRRYMIGTASPASLQWSCVTPSEQYLTNQPTYQSQLQLITGWITIPDSIIDFEVIAAAARQGINVDQRYIVLRDPASHPAATLAYERWKYFLQQTLNISDASYMFTTLPNGNLRLSLHPICCAIIKAAGATINTRLSVNMIFLVSFINAAIPVVIAFYTSYNNVGAVVVYHITSFIISFVFFTLVLDFVYCAFADSYRRYSTACMLHKLIRVVDIELSFQLNVSDDNQHVVVESSNEAYRLMRMRSMKHIDTSDTPLSGEAKSDSDTIVTVTFPQLNTALADNIYAWHEIRQVLQDFGQRNRFRLDVYCGATVVVMLVLLLISVSRLFFTENAQGVIRTGLFLQTFYIVFMITALITLIVLCGHAVNQEMAAHRLSLSSHLVAQSMQSDEVESTHAVVSALKYVLQAVEVADFMRPIMLLGVKCESALAISIASAVGFVYFVVIEYALVGSVAI